ncbi:hypothetical protein STRCI_008036 [Streptomyces cinnabarinus]|uniref:Uncharacterized protein n=1 Tax=Streptomyces cinnabarinus TaxID=67287 RepID=A0ABY7KSV1_9ACTN|nr:hypothetical protein [Streptomyces cinnabarinus]WAZ26457.1 hypothetical protein STRCI_008036 [Streptomyces cinnabarinus]
MTSPLGTYSFLPWLRLGLANEIQALDFDPAVKVRAKVNVRLDVKGDKVTGGTETVATLDQPVALFGPGDIVGVDQRAIFRVEPRDWVTNFEPNYLAAMEFYDEDLPWRYTPAAPDAATGRLRPWLALIVLEEGEFDDGPDVKDRPLPYVTVSTLAPFPKADELWAWAHVHVNRSLAADDTEFVSRNMAAVMPRFLDVLNENPDLAYSRIVCPRHLEANKAYHAFLMPTFETGRRAGLNLDLADVEATKSAWDPTARPEGQSFPYYYRWFFRTGDTGDFEALVRLLQPKPVDPRVGFREMDLLDPGSGVPRLDKPELGGILKLGGALQPPDPVPPTPPDPHETWDTPFPRPLQTELARLINLPDRYRAEGEPDPVITPPLYGTWHAMTKRVLDQRDGTPITPAETWVQRLNLDPRFRAAAGIGTRVIQDQQEKLMDAAWEQIGNVLEAQRRIRLGQFGLLVSGMWYDRHLVPAVGVSRQQGLLLMAPLNKRIVHDGATLHHAYAQSLVQPTMTSTAMRRVVRPRGRLVRSLPFDATLIPGRLIDRVNRGEVSAAPPKTAPPGVVTSGELAEQWLPQGVPAFGLAWLRRFAFLPLLVLLAAVALALVLLLLLFPVGVVPAVVLVAIGLFLHRRLGRWRQAVLAAELLGEDQTPESVDRLPGAPDFVITEPGSGFVPHTGAADSVEAARFKTALRDTFEGRRLSDAAGRPPVRGSLDLGAKADAGLDAIRPSRTIPRRVMAGIFVPPRIQDDLVTPPSAAFVEPMAYPVIDVPMYEPLKALSSELFLPNINLIEPNSVTLLQTNQRFIESYMVGLNHEFARELLWREYPTDQRGSTFRQFWDVRGFFNADSLDDETLKEKLRDIPPLHTWAPDSELGDHDNREAPGEKEDELVLAIRGELLKRYPNAVIYAHRACWQRKTVTASDEDLEPCRRSGAIDNTVERRLVSLTPEEELSPPKSKVLTPLYEAKVDPDIYFFGFDLTVDEAKGEDGLDPEDDPGWFFVIKERPGEPRFGLDEDLQEPVQVWNDLSWPKINVADGRCIDIAAAPATLAVTSPGTDDEKFPQFEDDAHVQWSRAGMTSAELAYVLFQAPVLVAFHASEMLPGGRA